MASSSSPNPFDGWPFEAVQENLHTQIREVREHPMFGKDFGASLTDLPPGEHQQLLNLMLREEAVRFMQDRWLRSRKPLPENIDLPLRILPAGWREIFARWPKKLENWTDHCEGVRGSRALRPMPDCVEILLQKYLEEAWNELNHSERPGLSEPGLSRSQSPLDRESAIGEKTGQLSPGDQRLSSQVGLEQIAKFPNPDLWRSQKRTLRKDRPNLSLNAFRASMNRIRKHHQLPSSKQLQKK